MRKCLLAILEAGYSPLRFYTGNMKKYFYLGELLALVDLSLACALPQLLLSVGDSLDFFVTLSAGLCGFTCSRHKFHCGCSQH